MHKTERQDEILAILKKNKYASVHDLGAALYASQPTIRRDLASLEAAGYVMRSHRWRSVPPPKRIRKCSSVMSPQA